MAKAKTIYVCQNCAATSAKWIGKCNSCGEWNTYVEEVMSGKSSSPVITSSSNRTAGKALRLDQIQTENTQRYACGVGELDRVLGGGIVPGAIILLGGEPGIGKSTLVLQLALTIPKKKILYVSGEESVSQIKLRAQRLNNQNNDCYFVSETSLECTLEHIDRNQPDVLIIDSIQTISTENIDSSAGSVAQIRECSSAILKKAKAMQMPVFLIGHITKEGSLAGPKVLEHIVDTVLQFEGDRNHFYRILRATKNRFGSTSEIGIFEMRNDGLRQVSNPSEMLVNANKEGLSGTTIAATIEGMRPFLIEVQSLVSSAAYGNPQRSTTGFDARRLNMLLAVLERRAGFKLVTKDVFLNIAGGIKVADPAIDLAVICAVLSSNFDMPISQGICFAGEVGLTGEVRPVMRLEQRIAEAEKLGFNEIIVPAANKGIQAGNYGIKVHQINNVGDALRRLFR